MMLTVAAAFYRAADEGAEDRAGRSGDGRAVVRGATATALTQALGQGGRRQVTLTERVDPSIIGGVVAKVGSVVFDGSVTRQLERLGREVDGRKRRR